MQPKPAFYYGLIQLGQVRAGLYLRWSSGARERQVFSEAKQILQGILHKDHIYTISHFSLIAEHRGSLSSMILWWPPFSCLQFLTGLHSLVLSLCSLAISSRQEVNEVERKIRRYPSAFPLLSIYTCLFSTVPPQSSNCAVFIISFVLIQFLTYKMEVMMIPNLDDCFVD